MIVNSPPFTDDIKGIDGAWWSRFKLEARTKGYEVVKKATPVRYFLDMEHELFARRMLRGSKSLPGTTWARTSVNLLPDLRFSSSATAVHELTILANHR
ncbi:hypothetical protein BC938DRAFT_471239 [Jimgerdemannia flammicorona]|uniref:Uncharacterized protein n=1 Tax=Jimgerdemannia flammicorona TaxID=994334 RepID=A0A433Q8J7_9FUNG|nr:hypothetical protein BC938DRAFT_471239 [Jimgerdemannia flammicorona]